MVGKEKYPMLLGCIKLLTKVSVHTIKMTSCSSLPLPPPQVATLCPADFLRAQLPDMVPGLMRGYSHQESSVRKASVFCLVAIHAVVGPEMKQHLSRLSSSQVTVT